MKYRKLSLFTLLAMIMVLGSCLSMPMMNQPSGDEKALTTAVLYRNAASVESQLKNGVSPNSRAVSGLTALMIALGNNDTAMAEMLVSYGADINLTDNDGATALFHAKKPIIQQWLISKGANLNILSKNKRTAFERWCLSSANITSQAQKNQTMYILKTQGIQVSRADMEKYMWVNSYDISQSIKIFINAGYDINSTKSDGKETPLILASGAANFILMEALLAAGADPRLKNKGGDDSLNLISKNPITTQTMTGNSVVSHSYAEYRAVVYALLIHGADIHSLDKDGNTPLCNAATVNNANLVSALLSMKTCKVDRPGQYGETALFKTKNYAIVQTLIAYGANVNFESTWGYTPLFTQSNVYIVQYLINMGANVNHINKDGENILVLDMYNAYDSFKRSSNSAVEIENHYVGKVQILINSGINVNHQVPNKDKTALYYAKAVPLPKIVALLVGAGAK